MIKKSLYNWLIGFILPWIAGIYLYKKNSRVLLLITPFASLVAYIFNCIGYFFRFWKVSPAHDGLLATMPMNFGVYGILGSLLIYTILLREEKHYITLLIFTTVTTLMEAVWFFLGFVAYRNHWNLGFTFLSYLLAYLLLYGYYYLLKKHNIFRDLS